MKKIALIGQEMPALLTGILADWLFASEASVQVWLEERGSAMQDVLQRYADAVCASKPGRGSLKVSGRRREVLQGADCVIYAGDLMAASRFRMDREALNGVDGDDEGLTDQARVCGGLGGLMHTLRQGEPVYALCDEMADLCPQAVVITLGQPVARTAAMFAGRGFRVYGLCTDWMRGVNGLEGLGAKLRGKPDKLRAVAAGLPDFLFLLSLTEAESGRDRLEEALSLARDGALGRLKRRWLLQWDALAVGNPAGIAEFLPAQEDYAPDPDPSFGESIGQRKERILWMNTVGDEGIRTARGQAAHLLLLSRVSAQRPMRLALALLGENDADFDTVVRVNRGAVANLPGMAVAAAPLRLREGCEQPETVSLPGALAEVCLDIDEANRLAARAAAGDRGALRDCIEIDPAMAGLDRLYLYDVADRMIDLHADVLSRWNHEEDEE